jgi:hypothetical protein
MIPNIILREYLFYIIIIIIIIMEYTVWKKGSRKKWAEYKPSAPKWKWNVDGNGASSYSYSMTLQLNADRRHLNRILPVSSVSDL